MTSARTIFRDMDSHAPHCTECETLRHHLQGRPLCGPCATTLREDLLAATNAYEEIKNLYEEARREGRNR